MMSFVEGHIKKDLAEGVLWVQLLSDLLSMLVVIYG